MKIEILCNVVQHGEVHGTKGQQIVVPDEIGAALLKEKDRKGNPRVKEVKETKGAK